MKKAMHLLAYYSAVVSLKVEDVRATVCLNRGMEARPLDDCLQKMTQLIKVPGNAAMLVYSHSNSMHT